MDRFICSTLRLLPSFFILTSLFSSLISQSILYTFNQSLSEITTNKIGLFAEPISYSPNYKIYFFFQNHKCTAYRSVDLQLFLIVLRTKLINEYRQ